MRRRDLGVLHSRVSQVSISDAARPAPSWRHKMRKGRSVTPAMGARTTADGNTYLPICMLRMDSVRVVRAGNSPAGSRQARVDLESDCVGARVYEGHFRVNTLSRRQKRGTGYRAWQVGLG